jgi:hypothetical protein
VGNQAESKCSDLSSAPFFVFVWPAQQLPVTLASQPLFKPQTASTHGPQTTHIKIRLLAMQQCDLPLKLFEGI